MTGRVCFGIELSPHYVDVVVRRWQLFTGLDDGWGVPEPGAAASSPRGSTSTIRRACASGLCVPRTTMVGQERASGAEADESWGAQAGVGS